MEPIDVASVALRAAAFTTALQAAGLAVSPVWEARPPPGADRSRGVMGRSALTGVLLVVAHRMLDAGRMAGEWSGVVDPHLEALLWSGRPGLSSACCVAGLLAIAAAVSRGHRLVAALGAFFVALSFALTGHTTEASASPLLRALLVLHVGIAAFWLGSVAHLHALAATSARDDVVAAAARFSAVAVWLVPLLLPAGIAVACGLLPDIAALRTPYGGFLLAKAAGFGVLLVLAGVNRLGTLPALRSSVPGSVTRFRRLLLAEYAVICAVLAATATMTSLFSWQS
jgi:putative copper export protein